MELSDAESTFVRCGKAAKIANKFTGLLTGCTYGHKLV